MNSWTYLRPRVLGPILAQATVDVGAVILAAAGLSFISLGPQPPTADWGMMINNGRQVVLSGSWWVARFPGLAIMLTALAFATMGDSLRAAVARQDYLLFSLHNRSSKSAIAKPGAILFR